MVDKIRTTTKNTKRKIETFYEVIAIAAAVAAAVKVATLPRVNDLPFWQVVAALVLAGVFVKIFKLLEKEV